MPFLQLTKTGNSKYLWFIELAIILTLGFLASSHAKVAEDSILEMAEIAVLLVCLIVSLRRYFNTDIQLDMRQLYLCIGFFVLFVICREFSWGRVFYYDEAYPITSEEKKAIKRLPHIFALRTGMPLLAVYFIYYGIRRKLYRSVFKLNFNIIDILILAIGLTGAIYCEAVLRDEVLEELFELLFYMGVFNLAMSRSVDSLKREDLAATQ